MSCLRACMQASDVPAGAGLTTAKASGELHELPQSLHASSRCAGRCRSNYGPPKAPAEERVP
jgi:hypothetical protein